MSSVAEDECRVNLELIERAEESTSFLREQSEAEHDKEKSPYFDQEETQKIKKIVVERLKTYKPPNQINLSAALNLPGNPVNVNDTSDPVDTNADNNVVSSKIKADSKETEDPIDKFCSIYGKLITDEGASFTHITHAWRHFGIENEDYFWNVYGKLVWENMPVEIVNQNIKKIALGGDHFNVRKLFSFLMHDWLNPEPCKNYALITKSDLFDSKLKLFDSKGSKYLITVLLEIGDHPSYAIYKNVVLRIFYQHFYELGQVDILNDEDEECFDYVDVIMGNIFKIKDHEMKISCLKVSTVFLYLSCKDERNEENRVGIDNQLKSQIEDLRGCEASGPGERIIIAEKIRAFEETKTFCQLCFLLANQESSLTKFQDNLDDVLKKSKQCYGDYSSTAMNRNVKLLLFMATKEQIYSVRDFLFRMFPEVGVNSTIMSDFEAVGNFTSFMGPEMKPETNQSQLLNYFSNVRQLFECGSPKIEKKTSSGGHLSCLLFGRDLNGQVTAATAESENSPQSNSQRDGDNTSTTEISGPGLSIFEKALETPKCQQLINLLWNKIDLSARKQILNMKNCHGKFLLEYVIASGDDENLLAFLDPAVEETSGVNLKMLNRQYQLTNNFTLFEHYIKVCQNCKNPVQPNPVDSSEKPKRNGFFENKFESLVECCKPHKTEQEATIEIHRDWAPQNEFKRVRKELLKQAQPIDSSEKTLRVRFFTVISALLEDCFLIEDIENDIPIDTLVEWASDNEHHDVREEIDDLLGHIVAYWSKDDPNYLKYKKKLLDDDQFKPFFQILFSIIEKHPLQDFKRKFLTQMDAADSLCKTRYKKREINDELRKRRDQTVWVIVLAAVLNERTDIVDFIFSRESINNIELSFPVNMRNTDATKHFAIKMLENGYEIGNAFLPAEWITHELFEKFLDTRLSYNGKNLIEVDTSFLLHKFTRTYKVESEADIDERLLLWEDTKALKYILDDESLRGLIAHPTIASYIDLKMKKFESIYLWNFLIFALLFAISFGSLGVTYFSKTAIGWAVFLCVICLIFMLLRELFQFCNIDLTVRNYWTKNSNKLEILLLFAALTTLVATFGSNVLLMKCLFVITMLLFTFDLLATVRIYAMPLYFIMLKKVAITFVKFFFAFLILLMAFTVAFWVFIGVDSKPEENNFTPVELTFNGTSTALQDFITNEKNSSILESQENKVSGLDFKTNNTNSTFQGFINNSTSSFIFEFEKNGTEKDDKLAEFETNDTKSTKREFEKNETNEDDRKPLKNFQSFASSFTHGLMKIILMLSGEYTVEPFTLTGSELALFFCFVIATFILYNLILGLSIGEVEKLRKDARIITLRQNARSIVETSNLCFKIYKKLFEMEKRKKEQMENKKYEERNVLQEKPNNWFWKIVSKPVAFLKPSKIKDWFWKNVADIIEILTSEYYLIHKIDKFYININTREVTFDINKKQLKALTPTKTTNINRCCIRQAIIVIKCLKRNAKKLKKFVFGDSGFQMKSDSFDYCKETLKI